MWSNGFCEHGGLKKGTQRETLRFARRGGSRKISKIIGPEKAPGGGDVVDGRVKTTPTLNRPFRAWFAGFIGMMALFLFLVASVAHATGRGAILEAIHCLENPRNLTRPGTRGELGPYQFRERTWRMHTTVPFARALDRSESDAVAVLHYEWLRRGLERAGMTPTPYAIALAWNSGLTATVRGRSPAVAHDYARRAENLAGDFERSRAR